MVPPTFRLDHPTLMELLWKLLHRHTHRCVILDPVKLTVSTITLGTTCVGGHLPEGGWRDTWRAHLVTLVFTAVWQLSAQSNACCFSSICKMGTSCPLHCSTFVELKNIKERKRKERMEEKGFLLTLVVVIILAIELLHWSRQWGFCLEALGSFQVGVAFVPPGHEEGPAF